MRVSRRHLLLIVCVAPLSCVAHNRVRSDSEGEPLAYGTAYLTEAPILFRSGDTVYLAPEGSSIVGPGFEEHLRRVTGRMIRAEVERDMLARQLEILQRDRQRRAEVPDTPELDT